MSKKAIIIGASSGIGRSLAYILDKEGYELGLVARRENLLEELGSELIHNTYILPLDISKHTTAINSIKNLINEMGGIDLFILAAGVGKINESLDFSLAKNVIDINVSGFVACANTAIKYFINKGSGHFVGISSLGAYFRAHDVPTYMASKAFVSSYMGSLRKKVRKELGRNSKVYVTDIKPGFVKTRLVTLNNINPPLMVSTDKAAKSIYRVIKKKKKSAFVPRRWAFFGFVFKHAPEFFWTLIP